MLVRTCVLLAVIWTVVPCELWSAWLHTLECGICIWHTLRCAISHSRCVVWVALFVECCSIGVQAEPCQFSRPMVLNAHPCMPVSPIPVILSWVFCLETIPICMFMFSGISRDYVGTRLGQRVKGNDPPLPGCRFNWEKTLSWILFIGVKCREWPVKQLYTFVSDPKLCHGVVLT